MLTEKQRETIGRKLIGAELLGKAEQLAHDLIETADSEEKAEIIGRFSALADALSCDKKWYRLAIQAKQGQIDQLKEMAGI